MNPQQPGMLFDQMSADINLNSLRAMHLASSTNEMVELTDEFLHAFLPLDAVAATGMFLVGAPGPTAAAKVMVGVGALVAVAQRLNTARGVYLLCILERRFVASEDWHVALYVCGARMKLMGALPASRTRTALAALRAVRYAAASENADALSLASGALDHALSHCSPRSYARVRDAAETIAEQVRAIPNPAARGSVRALLWTTFSDDPFPGCAEIAVEAANDYGELATSVWSRMVDGEEGNLATYLSVGMADVEEQDPVDGLLAQSRVLLKCGLSSISVESGRDTADAWVRKLVRANALPMPLILESYAEAMAVVNDVRHAVFTNSLGESDPDKESALRVIGIDPAAEHGGLER